MNGRGTTLPGRMMIDDWREYLGDTKATMNVWLYSQV